MALYALIDRDSLIKQGVSLQTFCQTITSLHAPIAQYRAKNISTTERIEELQTIRSYYQGKIIINDDINAIQYADGLHLGQEDLEKFANDKQEAISIIRQKVGDKMLGISTHNQDEIIEANTLNIDYIGLGAYRSTNTKKEAQVGTNLLEIAKLSIHPVALIGGVRLEDCFDEDTIAYQVVGSDIFNHLQG
ncbi:MAG: thiamine phosphate synthase [Campylobacterales bacterium]|nr:thiamine phosphate synthase [Campylobacterales bacterium]